MPCKHEGSAHVHLYALEREDEPAVAAVGHLSPSLSLFSARSLSSPPSFEAPGIFPGSLLQPVYNRQQRASEERGSGGGGAKQDFVLIPSFFPPHSYREPVSAPVKLGCREEAKESQIRCCPLHTD